MRNEFKASKFGALCVLAVGLMLAFFAIVAIAQGYSVAGLAMVVISTPFNVLAVRMLMSGGTLVFDDVGIDDQGRGFRLPWGSIAGLELKTETVNTIDVPGIAATGSIPWLIATLEAGAPRPIGAPRAGRKEGTIAYSLKPFIEEPEEIVEAARSQWRATRGEVRSPAG